MKKKRYISLEDEKGNNYIIDTKDTPITDTIDTYEVMDSNQIIKTLNAQDRTIEELKAKIELIADAMIKFEHFFYTKIYQKSNNFDDKTLHNLSEILLNKEAKNE